MRPRSLGHPLIACGVGAAPFLLYFHRLDSVPPYLAHDEIIFSLHAHAIATTWHDLNDRLMPLFFHVRHGSDSSSILAARRNPTECTGALRAFGFNVLGGFAFNVLGGFAFNVLSVKGLHGA